jgi:lipoic acid synthetase
MGLKYVVLTSVNRDDLSDGGASHYAKVVRATKALNPETAVEALTPDFLGDRSAVETLLNSGIEVFAQNVETVERLTHPVRDPRAGYQQTLDVLAMGKAYRPDVVTKTSLMLGLGERDHEIRTCMDDLRRHDIDVLTLGQYLQPTKNHLPVERFVTPDEFEQYREWGLERGFLEVVSGVFVRSSYRAERVLEHNNVGLRESRANANDRAAAHE